MSRFVRLIGSVSVAFALGLVGTARAEDPPAALAPDLVPSAQTDADAAALAEAYFDETERFDAFLTYEVTRGPARTLFTIARRWRNGLAELLYDIREPASFDKWALLLRQTKDGSDDLFFYAGYATEGRVRRLASSALQRQAIFDLFAPGDYRPTPRGELSYTAGPDEELDGVPCRVVIARARFQGFDSLELVFSRDSKQLLQSRYLRRGKEIRRLTTSLEDYQDIGGRRLPMHRVARRWADDGEPTDIVLKRVVETPDLPDGLFSHLNLRVQHFPEF